MKTCLFVGVLGWVLSAAAQDSTGGAPVTLMLDAGPHHRVVGVVRTVTGDDGQTTAVTNMFTELATGMNRFDVGTGAWMPAQAIFEPTADGHVVARQTQHQVILAPDIGEVPAVDLLTPDGVRLQSSPVGIAWVDQASGASLMVARLRNAPLQLVSPSEALAQDCFAGLKADVRFRLTLDAFSADVILREQPVLPPGFTPETTVLEVLTEFLDPPQPVIQPVSPATGGAGDVQLGFGVMALGCGQAFALPAGADSPSISVQKSWQAQDGQACLIEATAWPALQPLVSNLPLAGQASIRGARPERLSRQAKAPDRLMLPHRLATTAGTRSAQATTPFFRKGRLVCFEPPVAFAQSAAPAHHSPTQPGVVLDYTLLQSQTNFTFNGDTTYLVLGTVNLSGSTTVEGGTVVKYTNSTASPQISVTGTVVCNTGPYRPAVFTAKDDNTIGEVIPTSTGTPSGYYGNPAIQIRSSGQNLHDLHFRYAQTGVFFYDYSAMTANVLLHTQFGNCGTAIQANGYGTYFQNLVLRNTLIWGTPTAIYGYSFTGVVEHLTADQCAQLTVDYNGQLYGTTSSLALTNSLLANVTNLFNGRAVTVSGSYNGFWIAPAFGTPNFTNQTAPFQTAGAGSHYLTAGGSFFDKGTVAINAGLLTDLQLKTAYAPLLRTNPFVLDMVLGPTARRDNDGAPDLGYHYSPLDYFWTGLAAGATNATVTVLLTNGVVDIGFHYVACTNGTAVPFDTDGNGLPDYYEDQNGDGVGTNDFTNFTLAMTTTNQFGYNDLQHLEATGNFLVNDPQQDYATEQNTQWQPKVVALGDTVIVGYWDSNQGVYELGAYVGWQGHTNTNVLVSTSPARMVAYSVSLDGGQTFADMGVPPLLPGATNGDAGDPVLALDRVARSVYYVATSEPTHSGGRLNGVPLWKSADKGATFVRCPTVNTNILWTDYPWIAVDDWPGTGQHDVYIVIRSLYSPNQQYLMVSTDGSGAIWSNAEPVGDSSADMPQMVVGTDHTAYLAWIEEKTSNSLQLCAVTNRGAAVGPSNTICQLTANWLAGETWIRLLRSNTTSDPDNEWFKAFSYPALAVNPDTNSTGRAKHLYVAYADQGINANDQCDIFFIQSTNGGASWTNLVRVNKDTTTNDQWMPTITVKPDGNQLFIGWLDRRNDTNNSLIDVYGRWATISTNGTVNFFTNDFCITTQSFPPAFAGTLNTSVGSYDPVWPPGNVSLGWWYDWWIFHSDSGEWDLTAKAYANHYSEHGGSYSDPNYVYFVWADGRLLWTYHGTNPSVQGVSRYQSDIRLARLPWPQ